MSSPTIKNRKAFHDFTIEDTFVAGIALQGTEVKSIRQGNASFTDSFAFIKGGEVWLKEFYIKPFEHGSYNNHEPLRERKLLLTKKEIRELEKATQQKGNTIVPLKIFFKNGFVKVQIGLAKGKKRFDKRESIKASDTKRDIDRALKRGKVSI
ncbi:MAG: SsrA-binding protein SmpB [Balneolaceae bacterium]|nr:SsrA-binding protein SmpB [Balneolaceae bacterium]